MRVVALRFLRGHKSLNFVLSPLVRRRRRILGEDSPHTTRRRAAVCRCPIDFSLDHVGSVSPPAANAASEQAVRFVWAAQDICLMNRKAPV